ncbi:MAG: HK97 family phage prohead protease [Candidatus Peribacteraceae bacterium]|nr:HK97 family phage prohead protease [Candidatus Peribacteraceae bacterium]
MKFDADLLTQKKKDTPFKIKKYDIQHKEIDSTNRTVDVIVSTLNYFDYDFDALAPGCANRSMSDNGAKSKAHDKIAHLLNHDMYTPVGKSQKESEESFEGKKVLRCQSFLPETTKGDDTLTNYEVGIYNQHSTGFKYKALTYLEKGTELWEKWMKELLNPEDADEVGYGWKVSEIEWWEYSTVVFGANKLTQYLGTKSTNKLVIADVINKKIAILANKAMRREIKNRKEFDFELAQLQQMILELSEKDSPKENARQDSLNIGAQKEVDLSGFSEKLIIN